MTAKARRTVGRLLVTYLVVLLIPLLASVFVFQPAYRQVQANTRKIISGSLQQTAVSLNQRIEEIETIAYELFQNSDLIRFSRYTNGFQGETPSRLLELQHNLPNYGVSNKFIRGYYVLFPQSGIVLNNQVAYDYPDFFRSYIRYGGIGAEQWDAWLEERTFPDFLQDQPVRIRTSGVTSSIFDAGQADESMATFVFRSEKSFFCDMYILILVERSELDALIQSSLTTEGGYIRISGRNGRILYENGAKESYGGYPDSAFSENTFSCREENGAFVAEYHLEESGWKILSIRPYAEISRNLMQMSRNIWIFVLLSLALGFVIAAFFSLRKSAPVMTLLQDNRAMEEQLQIQKPLLLNTFLERLLMGNIGEKEIRASADYLQFPDLARWRCAMVHFFDFRREGEDAEQLRLLFRSAMEMSGEPHYCHGIDSDKIVCIFPGPSTLLDGDVETAWQNLIRKTEVDQRCRIAVAIGEDKRELKDLHLAVKELLHVLEHKNWEQNFQILRTEDCNVPREMVQGTCDVTEWLVLLKNCIQAGAADKTAEVFRTVRASLLAWNDLRQNRIFLYSLLDYLEKGPFSDDPEVQKVLRQIENDIFWGAAGDLLHRLEKICIQAAEKIQERTLRRKQTVFDELIQFINENYARQDLSLSCLSAEFGISETYLSQQFKRRFGENLSVYIENIRMQRAQELLLHSRLTINEIAQKVGYNSANTFGKVFHKKYNVSPSVYRSSQKA